MEFKVLGASPKNLRAIENALSIKGSYNSVEYPKADMGYKDEEEESLEFVFPFQMSVTKDEEGSANLSMKEGRVQINTQYEDRVYVFPDPELEMSLDELEAKTYRIILLIMYDTNKPDNIMYTDSRTYSGHIYFVEDGATTANIPQTRGIFSIPLGYLTVEEVQSDNVTVKSYSIEQEIIGSFPITMGYIHHPFSITATIKIEDGKVKNTYEKGEFKIRVQGGNVVLSDDVAAVEEFTFTPEFEKTYVYAHITPNATPKAVIETSKDQYGLFGKIDEKNPQDQYYILIGCVDFNEGGLEIIQETTSTITFTADTYKVKVIEEDATPGFLSGKFRYMDAGEKNPISGYINSFIGADLIKEKVSGEEGEEERYNYFLSPTFLYKEIKDYSEDKKGLVLSLSGGNLMWAPASGGFQWDLSGCLTELFELRETKKKRKSSDKNEDKDKPKDEEDEKDEEAEYSLVWKSEFDELRLEYPYILFENAENGSLEKVTYSAYNVKQGLFVWDFPTDENLSTCGPNVVYPPAPETEEDEDKKYIYVGNQNGFEWQEYQGASGSISLTGSILNVFDVDTFVDEETGEEKQCLYIWTEIDPDYEEQFHWLTLQEDGTLDYGTYDVESFTGFESIQCFDNETKTPFALPTEPYNEDEFYLLGGDDENGLYWTPLFETISGICNVVSVTENDDMPSFLIDKIYSDDLSLNIEERSHEGYQYLNIDINPDYFVSTNDSIIFDLFDEGEDSQGLDVKINPDYFGSSDGSIVIEPLVDGDETIGLDFVLSTHMVQVNESDAEPGFLQDKLEIDQTLATFLILEPSEDNSKLMLKPAIEGTGLLAIQNGEFQVIEAPTEGSFILTVNNGAFSWEPVSDCENACSPEGGEEGGEETEGEA
jgi:hypothetical protein